MAAAGLGPMPPAVPGAPRQSGSVTLVATLGAVAARPPGPAGLPLVGNTLQLARDPLRFLAACARRYGEAVFLRVRGLDVFMLVDPDLVESVLVGQHRAFTVDRLSRGLADALGNSLLVSEGAYWERQRRLVQPALQRGRIREYAATTVELTRRLVATWRHGQTVDAYGSMMDLALDIVTRTLLGHDVSGEAAALHRHLDRLMDHVLGIANSGVRLPLRVPTPGNRAASRALQSFDRLIYAIIGRRRAAGDDADDLVGLLVGVRDEDGGRMSDRQIRDELLTMLLVGHETSALALTYAFWLLGTHPEALARVSAEVDAVLGKRAAAFDDVGRLRYTEHVFKEALRLYPPVWAMGREALHDCDVGGYPVRKGAQVLLSPWVSHRNPRFFAAPDAFRPERWDDQAGADLPPFAYFPFGGGPRTCLGSRYATMECVLILATVVQRFAFRAERGRLALLPTVTLRPRHPVRLTLAAR
jgi:cytochrome P450